MLEQDRSHAIVLLDPHGRTVGWLAGAPDLFGYPAEEICDHPLDQLFVPEDRERGAPRLELEIAASSMYAEDDRWQLRKDGSRFWAAGALTALRRPNGELLGFCKVLRDRTEVRSQIEGLENRAQEVIERDRQQSLFLATLAHELRSPLAPLSNAAEVLRQVSPRHTDMSMALGVIERQIEVLRRFASDLGELIRAGSGMTELQRDWIDLRSSVRAAIESCRDLIDERGHHIEVFLSDTPIHVLADRIRMQQVLINLLTNAAKYTPRGGHIWVSAGTEGREAVIRIRDDGVGIPGPMQEQVFDLFTQAGAPEHMARGGFGLGLALVKELVQLHGGSVHLRSEGEHHGSEFSVRLPLERHEGNGGDGGGGCG